MRARVETSVRCTAALLLTGAAVLSAHRATLVPRLRDPAVYFVCEGVEGGIATGATWPVPPCFLDRTDAARAAEAGAALGAVAAAAGPSARRAAPAAEVRGRVRAGSS